MTATRNPEIGSILSLQDLDRCVKWRKLRALIIEQEES